MTATPNPSLVGRPSFCPSARAPRLAVINHKIVGHYLLPSCSPCDGNRCRPHTVLSFAFCGSGGISPRPSLSPRLGHAPDHAAIPFSPCRRAPVALSGMLNMAISRVFGASDGGARAASATVTDPTVRRASRAGWTAETRRPNEPLAPDPPVKRRPEGPPRSAKGRLGERRAPSARLLHRVSVRPRQLIERIA